MVWESMDTRKWIHYEDDTFEPVAKHENINMKRREPGRDWFVVDKSSDWLPPTFAKEATEPRHEHEPWFQTAKQQVSAIRDNGINPYLTSSNKGPLESILDAGQEQYSAPESLYGNIPWNPHLHTGHAAASLTTGKVRTLSGGSGFAATQGAQGVVRGKDAASAPLDNWDKLKRNVARAAEKDKTPWIDHGSYNTEENLDKARKVVTTSLLAAPLAIPLGAASGGIVYGAVQGAGALAGATARTGGAMATTAFRAGKSLLSRAGDFSVEHPRIYKWLEGAADSVVPLPPATAHGQIIVSGEKAKDFIENKKFPWED